MGRTIAMKTHRVIAVVAVLFIVSIGCSVDIHSLAPFPCSQAGTCPSPLQCNKDKMCVETPSCHGSSSSMSCNGTCTDTGTDPSNCGHCGTVCAAGGCCSGLCTDKSIDIANCGVCGTQCPNGADCTAGSCICRNAETICSDTCVDLKTDKTNCGACGTKCPSGADCTTGVCICRSNTTVCGDACVDLQTDATNCGRCGNACKKNATCNAGHCECPANTTDCPTLCTNLQTDAENCGQCSTSCAAPHANVACQTAMCTRACAAGYSDCNADLTRGTAGDGCEINTATDTQHCGSCMTACTMNKICASSQCQCRAPAGGGVCDMFPPCGCTAGQNCVRTDTSNMVVPERCITPGNVPPYSACTSSTDCQSGFTCVGRACKAACATNTDCPGAARKCEQVQDSAHQNMPIPGWFICTQHCNPLQPTTSDAQHQACGASVYCVPSADGATDCVSYGSVGSGAQGTTCTTTKDCSLGFDCVTYNAMTKCARYCRVGVDTCAGGLTCKSYQPKTFDGTQEIGVCL